MSTADINALLAEDRNEWDALCKVLDARPRGPVHGNGADAWNSRDVYAHLARWLRFSNRNLEKALAGENPEFYEAESQIEKVNWRWQQEDSQLTLAIASNWAKKELENRVHLICKMPAGFWGHDNLRRISLYGAAHFRDHRHYITGQ